MKRFFTISQISILASIFLSSCLGSKFLEPNEKLLVKYEIGGVSGPLKDEANNLIEQKPNSRPLGLLRKTPLKFVVPPFTHLAHLYKLGENGSFIADGFNEEKVKEDREKLQKKYELKVEKAHKDRKKQKLRGKMVKKLDKKDRKIREGNQLMRWGEKLAVYDPTKTNTSLQKIKLFLDSKGYFNATVTSDTSTVSKRKRTLQLSYGVATGPRFTIDSIQYIVQDSILAQLVEENLVKSPLRKGKYDQAALSDERDFIYNLAVNNGYFEFSKQYVSFEIDSTQLEENQLFIREIIRNPNNKDGHKIFYLDSIVFTSDASVTRAYQRTTEHFKGVTFNFGKNKYSKKILQWRIPLEQDDRYSRNLTIETQRQLSYLDNFKFVNINYDTTGNRFVANIFTSPFDRYQTSNEFGFTQNSGAPRPGPFFSVSLKNRNTFRGLETVGLDLNAKLEGITSVTEDGENYSSRQYGGQLTFDFPQLLFPLGRFYKKKMGRFNPRTRFLVGLSYERRVDEYDRRNIQTSFSYSWQLRDQLKYTLTPLQVSVIQSTNEQSFADFLDRLEAQGNTYANAFRSALVSSSSFQFDLNLGDYEQGKDGGFVRFFVEAGGNLNSVLGENTFSENTETYNFVKTNVDLRKIEKVTSKLNFAYRLNIGLAYAYGGNNSLPYEKYFFAGGSNSVRAWRPRRLGPGAFGALDTATVESAITPISYRREQPGDLLIETSLELRQKLVGFLEGAFFLDAGNVWLIKGTSVDPTNDPEGDDGKFRFNQFLNEVAVGSGLGLRFDLSFLILRFDVGVKLFDPAQPMGKRFVGDQIFRNFGTTSEFNIGIGYPF